MLTLTHVIFYLFALVAAGSAVAVITARHPVRSVLALVVTFFAMSGIWMTLEAEFLSLILLLVYVGAVMTLFLFVVMMLNIDRESQRGGFVRYLPLGIVIMILITGIMIVAVGPSYFGLAEAPFPEASANQLSNTQQLGLLLYTDYAYPFEIAGVILLAAIIAAITLTYRGPIRRRGQSISDQIAAHPKTSVRLVDLAREPKRGSQ